MNCCFFAGTPSFGRPLGAVATRCTVGLDIWFCSKRPRDQCNLLWGMENSSKQREFYFVYIFTLLSNTQFIRKQNDLKLQYFVYIFFQKLFSIQDTIHFFVTFFSKIATEFHENVVQIRLTGLDHRLSCTVHNIP